LDSSPCVCRTTTVDYLSRSPYVVSRDRQNLNLAMRRAMAMSVFAHMAPGAVLAYDAPPIAPTPKAR